MSYRDRCPYAQNHLPCPEGCDACVDEGDDDMEAGLFAPIKLDPPTKENTNV